MTIEVDATDADASGYEPIWKDGKMIGYITSGGYGYTIGKSLALALIEKEYATPGTELRTHIVGDERGCRIIEDSPYDPMGKVMRTQLMRTKRMIATMANPISVFFRVDDEKWR